MKLTALPALADNYIWMVHDGRRAAVVDPGEAQPVLDALERDGLVLETILVTHHHGDHTGGVQALHDATGATVYRPAREPIPGATAPARALADGDRLQVLGTGFEAIDVPGHTAGHIALYAAQADGGPLLFCGDTLFSAGSGRLFDGTPAQMLASLDRLAGLPGATRVCCGHEYTLANLAFAQAVEPGNPAIADHAAHCRALRARGAPTLPSTLALERRINPFLRSREAAVAAAVHRAEPAMPTGDAAAVYAALRQWKNRFKP